MKTKLSHEEKTRLALLFLSRKEKKMRTFIVAIFAVVCCGAAGVWYFGVPSATTEKQPVNIYKSTPAVRTETKNVSGAAPAIPAPDRTAESVAAPSEMSEDVLNATDPHLLSDTTADTGAGEVSPPLRQTSVNEGSEGHFHEAPYSSPQSAEIDIEAIRREGDAIAIEAARFTVAQLQQMSSEEQVETLAELKAATMNAENLLTGGPLFDNREDALEAWDLFMGGLIEQGYTPPPGF